jgi:hypothetical protein
MLSLSGGDIEGNGRTLPLPFYPLAYIKIRVVPRRQCLLLMVSARGFEPTRLACINSMPRNQRRGGADRPKEEAGGLSTVRHPSNGVTWPLTEGRRSGCKFLLATDTVVGCGGPESCYSRKCA